MSTLARFGVRNIFIINKEEDVNAPSSLIVNHIIDHEVVLSSYFIPYGVFYKIEVEMNHNNDGRVTEGKVEKKQAGFFGGWKERDLILYPDRLAFKDGDDGIRVIYLKHVNHVEPPDEKDNSFTVRREKSTLIQRSGKKPIMRNGEKEKDLLDGYDFKFRTQELQIAKNWVNDINEQINIIQGGRRKTRNHKKRKTHHRKQCKTHHRKQCKTRQRQ